FDQAFELLHAGEGYRHSSGATRVGCEDHAGTETLGDPGLETLEITIAGAVASTRHRAPPGEFGLLRDPLLRLANRKPALDDFLREHDLRRAVDGEQGAGVAHVEIAGHEHSLHRF